MKSCTSRLAMLGTGIEARLYFWGAAPPLAVEHGSGCLSGTAAQLALKLYLWGAAKRLALKLALKLYLWDAAA